MNLSRSILFVIIVALQTKQASAFDFLCATIPFLSWILPFLCSDGDEQSPDPLPPPTPTPPTVPITKPPTPTPSELPSQAPSPSPTNSCSTAADCPSGLACVGAGVSGISPSCQAPPPTANSNTSMRFGSHASRNQCNNPIAFLTNNPSSGSLSDPIPERGSNDVCNGPHGYCVGDCVAVSIQGGGQESGWVNVIVGGDLPDPGNCSAQAASRNYPGLFWDFTKTGKCGSGDAGPDYYHGCLVHDVCVWARCTDDSVVPGGPTIELAGQEFYTGGDSDVFCGDSFRSANVGWARAHNGDKGCVVDQRCTDNKYSNCIMGECRAEGLVAPSRCFYNTDCEGYCQFVPENLFGSVLDLDLPLDLALCFNGDEGDYCGGSSDCKDGMTCKGIGPFKQCRFKLPEGSACLHDNDCEGYCELRRCYDGSPGDRCGRGSDCQSGRCDGLACLFGSCAGTGRCD